MTSRLGVVEALWQMAEALNTTSPQEEPDDPTILGTPVGCWQERYRASAFQVFI